MFVEKPTIRYICNKMVTGNIHFFFISVDRFQLVNNIILN